MASQNQKTLLIVWTVWQYFEAAILITIGILTIVNTSNLSIVVLLLGILIILDGLFRLGIYYTSRNANAITLLLMGIIEITLGICFCIEYSSISGSFSKVVMILLLVAGACLIPDGIIKLRRGNDLFLVVLEFILAAILIALGIACLICMLTGSSNTIITIFAGVFLVLLGVGIVVITTIKLIQGRRLIKGSNDTSRSLTK